MQSQRALYLLIDDQTILAKHAATDWVDQETKVHLVRQALVVLARLMTRLKIDVADVAWLAPDLLQVCLGHLDFVLMLRE